MAPQSWQSPPLNPPSHTIGRDPNSAGIDPQRDASRCRLAHVTVLDNPQTGWQGRSRVSLRWGRSELWLMDERPTSTLHHGRSGLLAALLTLVLLSGVPDTLASGRLRAEAQGKKRGVAGMASTVPGDDGVKVRHLVSAGETFASILGDHGFPAVEIKAWEQAVASAYEL